MTSTFGFRVVRLMVVLAGVAGGALGASAVLEQLLGAGLGSSQALHLGWGVLHVMLGLLVLAAGLMLGRQPWVGVAVGAVLAVDVLTNVVWLGAEPWRATLFLVIDLTVVLALGALAARHGPSARHG